MRYAQAPQAARPVPAPDRWLVGLDVLSVFFTPHARRKHVAKSDIVA
jgi:hypothetical protein